MSKLAILGCQNYYRFDSMLAKNVKRHQYFGDFFLTFLKKKKVKKKHHKAKKNPKITFYGENHTPNFQALFFSKTEI